MKEVKFHKLTIKNFLSIGDEPVIIDFKQGLNIITGVNKDKEDSKNGVGKSTIVDSISFAIFGSTIRDIRIENIPNWKTNKTCEVSIEFTVIDDYIENKYRINRSLDPSRVQLYENGDNISRTAAKTNSKLKKILGTTPELFEQSTTMSINQTEPFLKKRPGVKRKFIEGIFKLTVFSEMLGIIRHDLSETKRKFHLEKTKLEEIQKSLILYKKQQTEHANRRRDRIQELEQRRLDSAKEIKELKNQLLESNEPKKLQLEKKIETLHKKEQEYEAQIRESLQVNTAAQTSILTLREKIQEINDVGDTICITCKRPFEQSDKDRFLKQKQEYVGRIQDVNEQIDTITKEQKQIENLRALCKSESQSIIHQIHQLDILETEAENIKQRILQRGQWIKQIEVDINSLQTEKDTYIDIIQDTTKRINALTSKQGEFEQLLEVLDISKFVVSEEGVRSFIVKKMLKMLNTRLNYYLKKLDANCICTFDEYFEESIFNQKGRLCSYANFSDGERKRIDLAMLFTFLDIRRLQSNISVNFSFYDELLDSSLDSKGIECVLEILKDRINQYGEAVYIISHKNEAIKHATGEIIYLEKQNEVTRRLEYGTTV